VDDIKEFKRFLVQVGKNVRDQRLQKDLSQSDLGRLCIINKSCISRIETGDSNFSMRTLIKICRVLEVSMIEIFETSK